MLCCNDHVDKNVDCLTSGISARRRNNNDLLLSLRFQNILYNIIIHCVYITHVNVRNTQTVYFFLLTLRHVLLLIRRVTDTYVILLMLLSLLVIVRENPINSLSKLSFRTVRLLIIHNKKNTIT